MAENIDAGAALGATAVVITITNTVWGWLRGLKSEAASKATEAKSVEGLTMELTKVSTKVDAVATALAAHQVAVAREYVSNDALAKMETRLLSAMGEVTQAVGRLGDRVDRAYENERPRAGA